MKSGGIVIVPGANPKEEEITDPKKLQEMEHEKKRKTDKENQNKLKEIAKDYLSQEENQWYKKDLLSIESTFTSQTMDESLTSVFKIGLNLPTKKDEKETKLSESELAIIRELEEEKKRIKLEKEIEQQKKQEVKKKKEAMSKLSFSFDGEDEEESSEDD
eukprot:TRINITY_DN6793_c0_g1_i1.p1 TRINITY_DN6793_c0_g1~~TRINITY_DN6793_c0_g1_i1.p1  ORF type:complete len:160 (-),score=100.37 TRINITY_DN6793_c0_g1_i1:27-506(-)